MRRAGVDLRVPFVGRAQELRRLAALLDEGKPVALVGPGGVGKTRLALEATTRWAQRSGGTAHFVALIGVAPQEVAGAVASALGIAREPGRSALDSLGDARWDSAQAIVLDNCEDAAEAAGAVAARLRANPGVVVVTTSRSRLVADESVFDVAPFSPDDGRAFFAARARLSNAVVDAEDKDRESIATIVERLDGLAVAIDLAAARLASLSVAQLCDELTELRPYHFRSTASPERRHWTLKRLVEWSLEKLDGEALALFAIVSRFANVFRSDDVAALTGTASAASFAALEELCARSLLVRAGDDAYAMLAPIRAVAARRRERMRGSADVDRRFAERMNELGSIYTHVESADDGRMLGAIAERYDDYLSALDWGLGDATQRIPQILNVVGALTVIWTEGGRGDDGLRWYDRVLPAIAGLDQGLQGRITFAMARVALACCEYDRVLQLGTRMISTFTIGGDRVRLARTYNVLSVAALYSGHAADAQIYADTAAALYEAVEELNGSASAQLNQGCIAMDGRGDAIAARAHFLRALEYLAGSPADLMISLAEGNLAEAAALGGDWCEMERRARRACDGFAAAGNAGREAWAHCLLAYARLAGGSLEEAARELCRAFDLLRQQPNPDYLARCTETAATLLAAGGDGLQAAVLAFAAQRFRLERRVPAIGAALGDPQREAARIAGGLTPVELARARRSAEALPLADVGRFARRALTETFEA